jgi:hypothetical protein
MSDYEYTGKDDEKREKEHEKHEKEDMTWDEKWRRDPLNAAGWAVLLIWAGLVLLADNLGLFARWEQFSAWGLILTGAGLIVLLEAALRLLIPAHRRPVAGSLIWGAILLGLGLGNLIGTSLAWPLILIALGIGLLLRGLIGSE